MKSLVLSFLILASPVARAEAPCDLRPGTSVGVRVIEFTTGHVIHSKIPLSQSTAEALREEMINLQDMGICSEQIYAHRCVLKYEKVKKQNFINLFRNNEKWNSWGISSKSEAQNFVRDLKRAGFCS